MEFSSTKWLSEIEMNDSGYNHQWQQMSSLENSMDSFSFKPLPLSNILTNPLQQSEQQKAWKSCAADQKASSSSSSTIISFANSDSPRTSASDCFGKSKLYVKPEMESMNLENVTSSSISPLSLENPYGSFEFNEGFKRGAATRTPEQAQDHVLAERKRRERMTQKFVALSAIIPGLKKLDKATVLGDAIRYIRELQENVKKLEEEVKRNDQEKKSISTKRRRIGAGCDDASSSDENFVCSRELQSSSSSPEIEVRASDGNVLLRIYCEKQTAIIKEIFSEIERHQLTMVSSSIMPFGDNRLHITIVAQMDDQSQMTAKTLVDNLQMAILNLI